MCYFHHYYSGCTLMDMPQLLESRGCIKSLLRFIILGCIRISLSGNNIFQSGSKYQTLNYYCLFLRSDITIIRVKSKHSLVQSFFAFSSKIILTAFYVIQKTVTSYRKSHLTCTIAMNYISPSKPNVSWTLILYALPDVLIPVF